MLASPVSPFAREPRTACGKASDCFPEPGISSQTGSGSPEWAPPHDRPGPGCGSRGWEGRRGLCPLLLCPPWPPCPPLGTWGWVHRGRKKEASERRMERGTFARPTDISNPHPVSVAQWLSGVSHSARVRPAPTPHQRCENRTLNSHLISPPECTSTREGWGTHLSERCPPGPGAETCPFPVQLLAASQACTALPAARRQQAAELSPVPRTGQPRRKGERDPDGPTARPAPDVTGAIFEVNRSSSLFGGEQSRKPGRASTVPRPRAGCVLGKY